MARGLDELTVIYQAWERWSADVAESHSSYPSLLRFRSPEPHSSWVVSHSSSTGIRSVRVRACGHVQRGVQRTPEQAWPHFRGWRVNYEAAAYKLASGLDAVPARWPGPRRHPWGPFEPRRFANRTPEHPDGQR
jgi:hypothetical protein